MLLVDAGTTEEKLIVVKDYAPRSAVARTLFGRWLLRREARAYRLLAEVSAVPRMLGRIDSNALMIEYRPGVLLSRSLAGKVPSGFMEDLEEAVSQMHARGVVHLDLRHRSNILAGEEGAPVVIDFASALFFEPNGWLGRWLLPAFARIDLAALEKWRVRLFPPEPGTAHSS
ncbi:MAG: hypothetical protein AB8G23_00425 [Myxococcota bacterium]